MKYYKEYAAFEQLKLSCSESAKSVYVDAVRLLIEQYNTTIPENRFIVGGAVEVFTLHLLQSAGVECKLTSESSNFSGIKLNDGGRLSVNSSFTKSPIKLRNKQGEGPREWNSATVFVVSNIGIIFGAQDLVGKEHIGDGKDCIMLKRSGVNKLAKEPKYVLGMEIPEKPPLPRGAAANSKSRTAAESVLNEVDRMGILRGMNN